MLNGWVFGESHFFVIENNPFSSVSLLDVCDVMTTSGVLADVRYHSNNVVFALSIFQFQLWLGCFSRVCSLTTLKPRNRPIQVIHMRKEPIRSSICGAIRLLESSADLIDGKH